jgi:type I restriction-modification system DNA methylase subunit
VIGIMNMILHGIEAPNIVHNNTLTENITDIQDKDRFDVTQLAQFDVRFGEFCIATSVESIGYGARRVDLSM